VLSMQMELFFGSHQPDKDEATLPNHRQAFRGKIPSRSLLYSVTLSQIELSNGTAMYQDDSKGHLLGSHNGEDHVDLDTKHCIQPSRRKPSQNRIAFLAISLLFLSLLGNAFQVRQFYALQRHPERCRSRFSKIALESCRTVVSLERADSAVSRRPWPQDTHSIPHPHGVQFPQPHCRRLPLGSPRQQSHCCRPI